MRRWVVGEGTTARRMARGKPSKYGKYRPLCGIARKAHIDRHRHDSTTDHAPTYAGTVDRQARSTGTNTAVGCMAYTLQCGRGCISPPSPSLHLPFLYPCSPLFALPTFQPFHPVSPSSCPPIGYHEPADTFAPFLYMLPFPAGH